MNRRGPRALVGGICVAVAIASAGQGLVAKSAGPQQPTELVLVNNDGGGNLDVAPSMRHFIDRVRDLSGGRVVVRFQPDEWATDGREIDTVARGDADLGWVGTRALDLLGVDAFRPLNAPLLVDRYTVQAAIVGSEAADVMLAGLESLQVQPLGLIADELSFPAGVRPLRNTAEWHDARLWMLESHAYADAVTSLGATLLNTFADGGDIRRMLQDGSADGLVSMWVYYALGADYQHAPYVVPNVVLGPRTLVLFANPEAMAGLTSDERGWVLAAAAETVAWAAAHAADGVAGHIADACAHGARVVEADAEDLAGLRAAAEPLYQRLRLDPATAQQMTLIEALAATAPPDPPLPVPDTCRPTDPTPTARSEALLEPGATDAFPTGTYRYRVSTDAIVRGQENFASSAMAGTYTWVMGAGEWSVTARPDSGATAPMTCWGWFAADGDTVVFTHVVEPDVGHCLPLTWTAQWATTGDGIAWSGEIPAVLRPHLVDVRWERIG